MSVEKSNVNLVLPEIIFRNMKFVKILQPNTESTHLKEIRTTYGSDILTFVPVSDSEISFIRIRNSIGLLNIILQLIQIAVGIGFKPLTSRFIGIMLCYK
jgi:hypothetical protein